MAADLPPSHQQPAPSTSTTSSSYSAQHASSLFDAFLHQSDPALPLPISPSADPGSGSQRPSLSPPALAHSVSPSSSSSLAAALGSQSSPLPGTPDGHPLPAARNPDSSSPKPSGPDTPEKVGESPSHSDPKKPQALSTEQPLTAHGKPRERVYLACLQW